MTQRLDLASFLDGLREAAGIERDELMPGPEHNEVALAKSCPFCGVRRTVVLDRDRFRRWRSGEYVQVAFPDLSVSDREWLISGACGSCFDDEMKEQG